MSLADAIKRNRARQAAKSTVTSERQEGMRAFTVNVLVIPTVLDGILAGLRPCLLYTSVGDIEHRVFQDNSAHLRRTFKPGH